MENHQKQFHKILIEQEDSDGHLIVESLWADLIRPNVYSIKNIPFYAFLYSADDLVETENISSENFVKDLVMSSGNSTLRLSGEVADLKEMRDILQTNNCDTEMSISAQLLAVNIPKRVSYSHILEIVTQKCETSDIDYEEACISDHHKHQ